ncbi:hypothetical protein LguiB_015338 [Lonicera macranthoides]
MQEELTINKPKSTKIKASSPLKKKQSTRKPGVGTSYVNAFSLMEGFCIGISDNNSKVVSNFVPELSFIP